MMGIKYALIMAAGRGTRMQPLTSNIPKAMAPFNGTTLIANGIQYLNKHIPNIYATVGYKGSILAQHLIDQNISGVFNTTEKDNAWWIFNTLMREVDEPIFVLTCDNVIELDFALLTQEYFSRGAPPCMLVPVQPVQGLEGDYIEHEHNVVKSLSRQHPTNMYCSGIQVLHPKRVNELMTPVDNFYEVWTNLIQRRELMCSDLYPEKWYAIDTLSQLENYNVLKR
jgi:NDP-sugar pyrophosphorylase family protein